MNREKAKEIAQKVIAKSVLETNHQALAVGDLVFCNEHDACLKITGRDETTATVSDNQTEFVISLDELAHSEVVRVNTMRELYGDKLIEVQL